MLEITLLDEDKIVVLRPTAPLEAADFEMAAQTLDPEIERIGKLNGVMIVAESFPGWDDFSALASHLRFVRDHHREVARVAVVSDAMAFKTLPVLVRMFVEAEIRQFASGAEDDAREWLTAAPSPETALKFHRSENPPVLWIEIDGKITTNRYAELKDEMEQLLATQPGGVFLVRLKHFEGIEPAALWADLKFGLSHFKDFKRIGVVGDAVWLDRTARIVNALMPGEVRAFPSNHEEKAWDWVKDVT